MYEIVDNKGTLYSGSYEEMEDKFSYLINEEHNEDWYGDLKLIKVIQVYR